MENRAWLQATLRRSEVLGLEVLERASRRTVDWTNVKPTLRTVTTGREDGQHPLEKTHRSTHLRSTHLDQTFETVGAFMAQTTLQCMNFHRLDHCQFNEAERTHVSRFHTHQATGRTTPEPPTWKQDRTLPGEDFHIEVSPGSYTITAGMPHAHQQTQRVSLHAGDSITLTFDLSPFS
ncbi:A-kinase-interacting protein 1 [Merluccius polli]|uniref:A-kinase-interacting protein 1 n=1 Tax=Merluccius polli TaxID=89951 RepID=A0AA47M8R7_MERPO|nr:A-kinase-interacting protein 1 [Merluccius polli]